MKIAIINSVFPYGSTGKIVNGIAKTFASNNDEVFIAFGRGKKSNSQNIYCYKISSFFSILFAGLCARIFDNEGLNNHFSTRRFLKKLDSFKPDIVWLHNIHGYYINYLLLFNWLKQNPHVQVKWTLHDCWAFTGHCAYFSYAQCDQWTKCCENCCQKKSYPKSLFASFSKRNYTRKKESFCNVKNMELIVPSFWLAKLLANSFLNQYKVSVSYNKIDTNIFTFRKSNFRQKYKIFDKFVILGVASIWESRKGLPDFVQLEKLLDMNKFQIVLVGKIIKKPKEKTNFIYISRTSNAIELAEIYSSSNVFFNPTYEDNYPTVNLEAEACKCPVITYDSGGSSETLRMPESICLKSKNVKEVAEIIKAMEQTNEYSSN